MVRCSRACQCSARGLSSGSTPARPIQASGLWVMKEGARVAGAAIVARNAPRGQRKGFGGAGPARRRHPAAAGRFYRWPVIMTLSLYRSAAACRRPPPGRRGACVGTSIAAIRAPRSRHSRVPARLPSGPAASVRTGADRNSTNGEARRRRIARGAATTNAAPAAFLARSSPRIDLDREVNRHDNSRQMVDIDGRAGAGRRVRGLPAAGRAAGRRRRDVIRPDDEGKCGQGARRRRRRVEAEKGS